MKCSKSQSDVISDKFDALMTSVFELIDEMYLREKSTFSKSEKKFFDTFHDYDKALNNKN
ncbi:hypothetical protein [Paenibacillus elgii]|uniref:hypothetical protein n=1 Tax=Paenibacillus elgii TaxID=189691 RepID=UPI00203CD334|nr:hypothetical protein [Paenibacillus elgii]MCM3273791.1 hypothetical protein [Paenibacillus elgii]